MVDEKPEAVEQPQEKDCSAAASEETSGNAKSLGVFSFEGDMSLAQAIPLGLQHVLAMFVGNLTPLLIVTGACGLAGAEFADVQLALLQNAMWIAGVVTLVQLFGVGPIGGRVPIIMGTSSGFIGVFNSVAASMGGGLLAYGAIMGASIIGGLFEAVLGFFLKPLRRFFPAVVTGTVVLSIGLSLISVGVNTFGGGASAKDFGSFENLCLALVVLVVILAVKHATTGFLSASSILVGIIVNSVAQHVLAMFVGNLTPLLIVTGACGLAGAEFADVQLALLQNAMWIAGVVTLVQLFGVGPIGGRVPIIMGTSSGFIGVFNSVAASMGGGLLAYGAIMGASIIGGLFEAVLGFFLKPLRRFFPAVVTGTVVLSIGLSLISVGVNTFGGGASAKDFGSFENLCLALVVLVVILAVKHATTGFLSASAISWRGIMYGPAHHRCRRERRRIHEGVGFELGIRLPRRHGSPCPTRRPWRPCSTCVHRPRVS